MGEFCELIELIKADKEKFYLLMDKFKPLMNKYTRLLYFDESEDVHAELALALWESVRNIMFCENDGQVVRFISTALKNRFLELYRTSRRWNDNMTGTDDKEIELKVKHDSAYEDILIQVCLNKIYGGLAENKKRIFTLIFVDGLSDMEVASILHISRQYVHRARKIFYEQIKNEILI